MPKNPYDETPAGVLRKLNEKQKRHHSWVTPSAVHSYHSHYDIYVPERSMDDDLMTQWLYLAAAGMAWIIYDTGKSQEITKVKCYQTSSDWANTKVYVSDDPMNFGAAVWQGDLYDLYWIESGEFSKVGRYIKLEATLYPYVSGFIFEFDFWEVPPAWGGSAFPQLQMAKAILGL